ncbi:DUF4870 domain-containing protein [Croceiramulus getboli]|nr:DUF4870 domain-containing protein [Flavobacteriaceae bacterium YJPT1-3]
MENNTSTNSRTLASLMHLSTFSKWFIPFGNFIAPLILWSVVKKDSRFIDNHGRQALNFQLSLLIYTVGLILLAIPFFIWQVAELVDYEHSMSVHRGLHDFDDFWHASGILTILFIAGVLLLGLLIFELVGVISAAIRASEGKPYQYPLTINFIKEADSSPAVDYDTPDNTNAASQTETSSSDTEQ